MCGKGYTLSFIFFHDNTHLIGWTDLSPTIQCIPYIAKQLTHYWDQVCMDNLFNFIKLEITANERIALGRGIPRIDGCRISHNVLQKEEIQSHHRIVFLALSGLLILRKLEMALIKTVSYQRLLQYQFTIQRRSIFW